MEVHIIAFSPDAFSRTRAATLCPAQRRDRVCVAGTDLGGVPRLASVEVAVILPRTAAGKYLGRLGGVFTRSHLAVESLSTYGARLVAIRSLSEVSEAYRAVCDNRMSSHASSSSALNRSTSTASTTFLGKEFQWLINWCSQLASYKR